MNCISSPGLDDTQIMSYVDGEADEAVVVHIQQCPFCSERARQWTLLQKRLKKQSYRANCPTPTELGDYHLGHLSDPQELVIAQHLRECVLCRRELAELDDFLSSLAPETGLPGAAKALAARLINTVENSLAPALRGEAKGPLTFEVNGIVIILDIQSANEGGSSILGQVAGDDQDRWTGALVELRQGNELQCSTTVDDLGAFRCEGITTGEKELRIIPRDNSPIVVASFTIAA